MYNIATNKGNNAGQKQVNKENLFLDFENSLYGALFATRSIYLAKQHTPNPVDRLKYDKLQFSKIIAISPEMLANIAKYKHINNFNAETYINIIKKQKDNNFFRFDIVKVGSEDRVTLKEPNLEIAYEKMKERAMYDKSINVNSPIKRLSPLIKSRTKSKQNAKMDIDNINKNVSSNYSSSSYQKFMEKATHHEDTSVYRELNN